MSKGYTPMMNQYLKIKEDHPDSLLFFRLGDFYEMFFDDAKVASKELEIALTGRDAGQTERIPMCGVPYHAANAYIQKLIDKGYKVAIAEQLTAPGESKIVERGVVQIITPGTMVIDPNQKDNLYIAALLTFDYKASIAYMDLGTGEVYVKDILNNEYEIKDVMLSLEIKEVVVKQNENQGLISFLKNDCQMLVSKQDDFEIAQEYQYIYKHLESMQQRTTHLLLCYLLTTQKRELSYLQPALIIESKQYLQMDAFTKQNLELIKTSRMNDYHGSLLWFIDKTKTAMGSRLIKQWLQFPLVNQEEIEKRLDIVEVMNYGFMNQSFLVSTLNDIYDIERIAAKVSYGSITPRDLRWLFQSLEVLPQLKAALNAFNEPVLSNWANKLNPLDKLKHLIESSIQEDAPITIKDGGFIKEGFNDELDILKNAATNSQQWLANFEAEQREMTKIKNLKVGYNRVFGYYIEVSKGNDHLVLDEYGYERRQSLANAERYIHPELKKQEAMILTSKERSIELEIEIFNQIKAEVKKDIRIIQENAKTIAQIDTLQSFATIANEHQFTRPTFNLDHQIHIRDGRHPVIEKLQKSRYVENDVILNSNQSLMMITGPNMGGKSTYMRQIAMIVILAQMGSFVPSSYANLPIFDHIFTRIGASDDLVSGQSTFMVEMNEANHAIKHATKESLILFDEIGRGTSTFDGMAIAQAIIEDIVTRIQAKTFFSTHYHELTELEDQFKEIVNFHAGVVTKGHDIHFTYKMNPGRSGQSYGINVARLAGIPDNVLQRASSILSELESHTNTINVHQAPIILQEKSKVEAKIESIDPLTMSPLDALNFLYELKKETEK